MLRLAVELPPERPAAGPGHLAGGIDTHFPHQREVDHHAALHTGPPGDVVSAAPNGDLDPGLPGHAHRFDDVRHAEAARDHGRPLINRAIVYSPDLVIG